MDDRLAGRTALVTGAGRGIGLAVVERLQAEGSTVCALDRDDSNEPGDLFIHADTTDAAQVAAAVAQVEERFGGLDICVANAGVMAYGPLLESDQKQWREVIDVNLVGVMTTLQAAAAAMVRTGTRGRLLATASTAGIRPDDSSVAYCASKAGVIAVVQAAAVELASAGITVNAIAPGEIDTQMNAYAMASVGAREGRSGDEVRAEMLQQRIPTNRMGEPSEVAAVIAFLASDEAAYITGEVIRVDGGQLNA